MNIDTKNENLTRLINTPRMNDWTVHPTGIVTWQVDCVSGLIDLINDIDIKGKKMVEIGCYRGVSTETFLQFEPEKLYAVDIWGLNIEYTETNWVQNLNWEQTETYFREMVANYNGVDIIKNYSTVASKSFLDESLDFVYIDGEHSHTAVVNDIHAWYPKIKKGGYIGGHDIWLTDLSDAVKSVQFLNSKEMKTYKDTSWIVKI
jgi:predicted O-methyltransferase YrrM